jgi:hypothetical protein
MFLRDPMWQFWSVVLGALLIIGGFVGFILSRNLSIKDKFLRAGIFFFLVLIVAIPWLAFIRSQPSLTETILSQATNGTPTFYDKLNDNTSGNLLDIGAKPQTNGSCMFETEGYLITSNSLKTSTSCLSAAHILSDFTFQVNLKVIQGGEGGIVFHWSGLLNHYQFYYFFITKDGAYALIKHLSDGHNQYLSQSLSPITAIARGPFQPNLVTIIVSGNAIDLYVNQQHLICVKDNSPLPAGKIGFSAGPSSETIFSNMMIWDHASSTNCS